jgi:hypothetical protein
MQSVTRNGAIAQQITQKNLGCFKGPADPNGESESDGAG